MDEQMRGRSVAKAVASTGLSLVPGGSLLVPLTDHLIERSSTEFAETYSKAIRVAARSAGMSVNDLHALIADSPHLIPLHTRLMYFAARSRRTRVLDAAAAAVGDAASGKAPVDDAELMLTSLEALNDRHLELLRRVDAHVEPDRTPVDGDVSELAQEAWDGWAREANYAAWASTAADNLIVSQLVAGGLLHVETGGFGGYDPVRVTSWGHSLLIALAELSQREGE